MDHESSRARSRVELPGTITSSPDDHQLALARDEIVGLRRALRTSRTIGVAIGILVERYDISPDVAFAHLSRISQNSNRQLRNLAEELVTSGQTPMDDPQCGALEPSAMA
jgi:hypothetical protein